MPLVQMKNLAHLALSKLGLPDVVLDALLSSLPNLTSLGTVRLRLEIRSSHTFPSDLFEMEYMSDDFGQVFLAKGGNLLSLALRSLTAASNKSIEDVANGSICASFFDPSCLTTVSGCTRLTHLNVTSLNYTDTHALAHIGR